MTCDDFERGNISPQQPRCASSTVLVINSMKAVTPNPALQPFVRPRINNGLGWQGAVESSIENGDLASVSEQLFDQLNALQPSLVMKRGAGGNIRNGLLYFRRDNGWVGALRPAVHNAMTHPLSFCP